MASLARLMGSIAELARSDTRAAFLYIQLRRYMEAYGRGHFETAALYGRRITEGYCMPSLPKGHEA